MFFVFTPSPLSHLLFSLRRVASTTIRAAKEKKHPALWSVAVCAFSSLGAGAARGRCKVSLQCAAHNSFFLLSGVNAGLDARYEVGALRRNVELGSLPHDMLN